MYLCKYGYLIIKRACSTQAIIAPFHIEAAPEDIALARWCGHELDVDGLAFPLYGHIAMKHIYDTLGLVERHAGRLQLYLRVARLEEIFHAFQRIVDLCGAGMYAASRQHYIESGMCEIVRVEYYFSFKAG